jgi:hypothetical protein
MSCRTFRHRITRRSPAIWIKAVRLTHKTLVACESRCVSSQCLARHPSLTVFRLLINFSAVNDAVSDKTSIRLSVMSKQTSTSSRSSHENMKAINPPYSQGLAALDRKIRPPLGPLNPCVEDEGSGGPRTYDEHRTTETASRVHRAPDAPDAPDRSGASVDDFLEFMHSLPKYAQLVEEYRAAEGSQIAAPDMVESASALVIYQSPPVIPIEEHMAAQEPGDLDAEFFDYENDTESLEEPRKSSRRRRFVGKLKDQARMIPKKAHEATERLAKPVKKFAQTLRHFFPGLISKRHPYQRRG